MNLHGAKGRDKNTQSLRKGGRRREQEECTFKSMTSLFFDSSSLDRALAAVTVSFEGAASDDAASFSFAAEDDDASGVAEYHLKCRPSMGRYAAANTLKGEGPDEDDDWWERNRRD